MATVRVLILRAPGTNCDAETGYAFQLAGASSEVFHFNRLLEAPSLLDEFQILCIPGGFSFGDDIAAGKIFASQLKLKLGDALKKFRDQDRLMLGICNGFQVLLKTGLLVEDDADGRPQATLAFNNNGRYEARWVNVQTQAGCCAFIKENEVLTLPIAHAEGRFVANDDQVLDNLAAENRLCIRYVDEAGNPCGGVFPGNPNGAQRDVAGVCDATGRVFALMPHPERHVLPHHHPRWTRRTEQPAEGDGLRIFRNAVDYFG